MLESSSTPPTLMKKSIALPIAFKQIFFMFGKRYFGSSSMKVSSVCLPMPFMMSATRIIKRIDSI